MNHRNALPRFQPDWQSARAAVVACPRHVETSLHRVQLDGQSIWLKDEGERFGIGSFKALGGVYAVMQSALDRHAEVDGVRPPIEALFEDACRARQRDMQFVCASAGNHGVAVASGARLLGASARVHLSAEVPDDFVARLQASGAEAVRSGRTYEESLEAALQDARDTGATLLADTAWDGYVEVPACIMAGYTVIGEELREAFERVGEWPSDVYLQAGVGGLAGALTWMIRERWPVQPRIVIVEPEAAPCLARSHALGEPTTVEGPASTMGRLDCKTASPLAFAALGNAEVTYIAINDARAEVAVATLAGLGVATTPSGAAGFGAWLQERESGGVAGKAPLVIVSEAALG